MAGEGMRIALSVRRCEWCGHRCKGTACVYHSDLSILLSKHYSPKEKP